MVCAAILTRAVMFTLIYQPGGISNRWTQIYRKLHTHVGEVTEYITFLPYQSSV